MTPSQRGISRALVVLALSGAGTGIVGAVSVAAHADGLPNPTPLPTTDPTALVPGGVTDQLPLPGASDSPTPAPDGSTTEGTTTPDGSTTDASSTDSSTGQADAGAATGSAPTGATSGAGVSTSTKPSGHAVTNTGTSKTAPVTSTKVSTPTNLSLAKTAGGLTQGATVAKVTTPRVSASVPMTTLLHGLSLPNLPALPSLTGSSSITGSAQAPLVAAPPVSSSGATVAGSVSAQPFARASSSVPTRGKSPVAPALFALVAAAIAAGVAKVRIRWGRA